MANLVAIRTATALRARARQFGDRVTVAAFQFRNGRFGANTVSITRVAPAFGMRGGYAVNDGMGGDSFFYPCAVAAKAAYRTAVARVAPFAENGGKGYAWAY